MEERRPFGSGGTGTLTAQRDVIWQSMAQITVRILIVVVFLLPPSAATDKERNLNLLRIRLYTSA